MNWSLTCQFRHVHGRLQRPAEDVAADDPLGLPFGVAELAHHQRHRLGAHAPHGQPGRAALGVRVRARLEQQVDEVLMPVDSGHEQGSGAVGTRLVHVGSGPEEGADGADAALAHGKEERCGATVGTCPDIGAEVDQRLDDLNVSLGAGPHERRLAVPGLLCVDVGAGVGQYLHGIGLARPRREHQRRLASVDRLPRVVRIDAGSQQQGNDLGVAVASGEGQRRHAEVVGGVDVGPGPDQGRRGLCIVAVRGPVEGGCPVALRRVHIRVPREQRPHRRRIAAPHGVGEIGALRGGPGNGPCHVEADRKKHERRPSRERGFKPYHRYPD